MVLRGRCDVTQQRPNAHARRRASDSAGFRPSQARDGLRLVDVPVGGRGRRYLVERGLTEGELEALAEDYLAESAVLGACPMTRSRLDALVEALS